MGLNLAPLFALTWAVLGAGTGTVVVQAPAQVSGFLGGSLTLPCHLQPLDSSVQVTQVTWMRQNPEGSPHSVAVFHPTRGPSLSEPERVKFVADRLGANYLNASLTVSQLRADDEANYTCQFATFPMGSGSAVTWLRVLAKPQVAAETLDVPLSPFTGEPVPVARCISTSGRPPARITWSPLLNGTASNIQEADPLSGTYNVISNLTLVPSSKADGKNVICRVEHESFKEPVLLTVNLSVRYPPEVSISGYDDNWHIGRTGVALNCDIRSNPEPTGYDWSTTTGSLPSSAVAQGTQLLISTVDLSINTTFICSVTNALGTSQKAQTILVKEEPPHPGMPLWGIIVLVLLVGTLAAAFTYYQCHRHPGVCRIPGCGPSTSSANGAVFYSTVRVQMSKAPDEPDEPTESTR